MWCYDWWMGFLLCSFSLQNVTFRTFEHRKMFVGSRDEGCQFVLDATEVKKTPNCEGTPPVGKGDCYISSYWARRAGLRQVLVFGVRQVGSEEDSELAAWGQMEISDQQGSQTSKRTEKTCLYLRAQRRLSVVCLNFGNYRKILGCERRWPT